MSSSITTSASYILSAAIRQNNIQMNESLSRLSSGLRVHTPSVDVGAYFKSASLERSASAAQSTSNLLETLITGLKSAEDTAKEIKTLLEQQRDLAFLAKDEADSNIRLGYAREYDVLKSQIDDLVNNFTYEGAFEGENLLTTENRSEPLVSIDPLLPDHDHYDDITNMIEFAVFDDSIDSKGSNYNTLRLFLTDFGNQYGLNMSDDALGATDKYTKAEGLWDDAAAGQIRASNFYAALEGIRVDTEETSGLGRIERNITRISNAKSFLQGRLLTMQNKVTNYEAAQSAIVGVDEAKESTILSSTQILQQASASFLAQANAANSNVMRILFGFGQ